MSFWFILGIIGILSGLGFLFTFLPSIHSRRQVRRWRKQLNLYQHASVFHQIYQNLNGFILSQQARAGNDAMEYVYGEIEFNSFIALMYRTHLTSNSVFYDLGSGTGKAVIACAMVFDIKKSCGVELFAPLHHAAVKQKNQLLHRREYAHLHHRISFIHQDFLITDFSSATHIFINASALLGKTWNTLQHHVANQSPNATIITTTKPLNLPTFVTQYKTYVQMSWGVVAAYIQVPKETVDNIE